PPMVTELYRAMPAYVAGSPTSVVMGAYDSKERLSALFVVELAATAFATWVLGCYSRKHYVAHASDLLFREVIDLARGEGKKYISLGLGVNPGIKRFKEKWGGTPVLAYEFCERRYPRGKISPLMRLLQEKM
ncbi:MAG: GNAT family N-acetyltransferase, partial [Syntrophales bacterium LBB04]|nr:GNAT family N-acetyltransferase [Syntrophales bacterium LBB04]